MEKSEPKKRPMFVTTIVEVLAANREQACLESEDIILAGAWEFGPVFEIDSNGNRVDVVE